jgi:hypothetical protein
MNSRDALDATPFLQLDEESAAEYADWLAETAARDAEVLRKALIALKEQNAHPLAHVQLNPVTYAEAIYETFTGKKATGILTRCGEVLKVLLSDMGWHKTSEFLGPRVGGSEGMRRLRELKKDWKIEKRRVDGSTQWEYRLTWAK